MKAARPRAHTNGANANQTVQFAAHQRIVASVRTPDEVIIADDTFLNDTYSEVQYHIGRAAAASVND